MSRGLYVVQSSGLWSQLSLPDTVEGDCSQPVLSCHPKRCKRVATVEC